MRGGAVVGEFGLFPRIGHRPIATKLARILARRGEHAVDGGLDGLDVGGGIFAPCGVELREVAFGQGMGTQGGVGIVWELQGDHGGAQAAGEFDAVAAPLAEGAGAETLGVRGLAGAAGRDADAIGCALFWGHRVPHAAGEAGALRAIGIDLREGPMKADDLGRLPGENEIADGAALRLGPRVRA